MTFFGKIMLGSLILLPFVAQAGSLQHTIDQIETSLQARVGVAILASRSGETFSHRGNERFLMNSTIKVPLCAAVLARPDIALSEQLPVTKEDLTDYAPITKALVGGSLSVSDLCLATIDQSDNTAANVLFRRLGGPEALTAFLRSAGDDVSRSDRLEPALNTFASQDPRDTTSPLAMTALLQELLTGEVLSEEAGTQLADWMRPGGVTGRLIRPHVPEGWDVVDKSGAGDGTRNLIAMLTPPESEPIFVGLFISDTKADFKARNEALIALSAAVMEAIRR